MEVEEGGGGDSCRDVGRGRGRGGGGYAYNARLRSDGGRSLLAGTPVIQR